MNGRHPAAWTLALLLPVLLAAAWLAACEKTDPVADPESLIETVATPDSISGTEDDAVLDPSTGDPALPLRWESRISAFVLNTDGRPKKGVKVRFTTTRGRVTESTDTTNEEGEARTVLRLFERDLTDPFVDEPTVDVTARSGGASATSQIFVGEAPPGNQVPTAFYILDPNPARKFEQVSFDAAFSDDADGQIVLYDWLITQSLDPTNPMRKVEPPPGGEQFFMSFDGPQTVSVILRVQDDAGAWSDTFSEFGGLQVLGTSNQAPIADAGNDRQGVVDSPVSLSASRSTDPDGMIVRYDWDFGDNSAPAENRTQPGVNHTYTFPGVFAACVLVYDDGNGVVTDAQFHLYQEQRTDEDCTTVTITDPNAP